MNLITTAILAAAFAAATAFCGWRGAKPFDPIKGPRMMPWRPMMVVSAAISMFLLVHLLNLSGVPTGGGR